MRPVSNTTRFLPGLSEQGLSQALRKQFTSFGSPWRGLISLDQEKFDKIFRSSFNAVTFKPSDYERFRQKIQPILTPEELRQFDVLKDWSTITGYQPIVVAKNRMDWKTLKQTIRHERIHQQVGRFASGSMTDPGTVYRMSPIHQQVLQEAGGAKQAWTARLYEEIGSSKMAAELAEGYMASYRRLYKNLRPETVENLVMEEALANSQEINKGFFTAMEAKGLPNPAKASVRQLRQASYSRETVAALSARSGRMMPAADPVQMANRVASAAPQTTRSAGLFARARSIIRGIL